MDALNESDFWDVASERTATNPSVLVLVDMAGSAKGDREIPAPHEVESLIDVLRDRLNVEVSLGASSDESRLYAANRDVFALAELIGYRFVTSGGYAYDLIDLGENLRSTPFPEHSCLEGCELSNDWIDAGLRLNLARLRGDEAEGFAGGLRNLLNALPATDKQLHYCNRRDPAEVVCDLLAAYPPDFTLIQAASDARSKTRGAEFAIASNSPVLADYCAALKADLDPYVSALFESVAAKYPIGSAHQIEGSLEPSNVLAPPAPLRQRSTIARRNSEAGDRLVSAWLSSLDPELFPFERSLDRKAQDMLGQLVGKGTSPAGNALLTVLNYAVGLGGEIATSWRTLFLKDLLIQRSVSLGVDPMSFSDDAFTDLIREIEAFDPLIGATAECAPGLRWRKLEKAVLFRYDYWTAIPFDAFVAKADVSRAIGYMNDYLGGTIAVLERDELGRPVRQAERNLYLPQPNYIVLYGGQPIDVTKLETVLYGSDDHRLYWKTIFSTNGSAITDDGSASFARDGEGTRVTFVCKQRFVLPPLFQLFDISLVPDLEKALTTDAYRRFFERTCANLEALIEDRDIRIGRAVDEDTDFPSIALERFLATVAEKGAELFKTSAAASSTSAPDERGFVHVVPPQ